MTNKTLICEFRGPVAWITLNRPEKLNALSVELIKSLSIAIDEIEHNTDCRAVVITGVGRAFCAGSDLQEFLSFMERDSPEELEKFIRLISATFSRLENLPLPVIAAINGPAVAGGLELILCCDMVIASEVVTIGDGHLKFGVLPGGGATARLSRKIPMNYATELFLTAESKSVEWWHQAGLVNRIVDSNDLLMEVTSLAARLAKLSPLALADMKKMTLRSTDINREEALGYELDIFARHLKRQDLFEGLRAFAEKRNPTYRGH